jgi:hypothetical protein
VVKVREVLKAGTLRPPRKVLKGRGRVAFSNLGDVLFICRPLGKKEKWMKETKAKKSERYWDYAGAIRRLGHTGGDRILRRNFRACLQHLLAVEKTLLHCPVADPYRRALMEARGVLFNRLDLLKIERKTNLTIAAYVQAKRSKGDQRVLNAAVEKFARLSKGPGNTGGSGGGACGSGGSGEQNRQNRRNYNDRRPSFAPSHPPPSQFPVYLPPPRWTGYGGPRFRTSVCAPPCTCFDCRAQGHHKGDASCKGKK